MNRYPMFKHIFHRVAGYLTLVLAGLLAAPQLQAQCSPDVTPPQVTAPANITLTSPAYDALGIQFNNNAQLEAAFGAATATDNCGPATTQATNSTVVWPNNYPRIITRTFIAYDVAGNPSDPVTQTITIEPVYSFHIPAWYYPGDAAIDSMTVVEGNGAIIGISWSDQFWLNSCNDSLTRMRRDWATVNWFTYDPVSTQELVLPALDLNNDGRTGDAYDIIVDGDSVFRIENGVPVQYLGLNDGYFSYEQNVRFNDLDNYATVSGTVYLDSIANCAYDAVEPGLAGWKVKIKGLNTQQEWFTYTEADGSYHFEQVCPLDTLVEVSLDVPFNYGQGCPMVLQATTVPGDTSTQDIGVHLTNACTLLQVDIATNRIRPCFTNNQYTVRYANYSQETVTGTSVQVELDPGIQYTGSSIPGTLVGGNTYQFQTGDLEPGEGGSFTIQIFVDCDAPVGQTYCSEARIRPVDECPGSAFWSGSDLHVTGVCDGDSVRLTIENAGTGPMQAELEFVVVEDLIMYMQQPFQLAAGATTTFAAPANGATWRLETPQEEGHPWGGVAAKAIEGCGGLNTPGLVNAFPINTPNPFESVDCTQSTAAYDPNDKQAFPAGVGSEHIIRENTGIDYMIRFQNTGTDTAFTVVVTDTISNLLNVASVRPGASSHPYEFAVIDGNVLRFTFNNILLPDSNVNEPASNGFLRFRIEQQPDNPHGTIITNRAAIYFDFNAPIITNTVWHTVGDPVVTSSVVSQASQPAPLKAYPNPASFGTVTFDLGHAAQDAQFELLNLLGQTVRTQTFSGATFRLERGNLVAGAYRILIRENGLVTATGTIVLQ